VDSGFIYPVHTEEILPGDQVTMQATFYGRLTTPQKPIMDGIYIDTMWFFVPFKQIWPNFRKMMGEREDPADHISYTVPQMSAPVGGHLNGSLSDYLTIPTEVEIDHSSLYHRAYAWIYKHWFRDQNLTDSPIVDLDDGPDDPADYPLFRRRKKKDYISGCLPWALKGDPVLMPVGDTAPIVPIDEDITGHTEADGTERNIQVTSSPISMILAGYASGASDFRWDNPGLQADLQAATGTTLEAFRTSIALQHLQERDARSGTRYPEMVWAGWGVQTDDIRMVIPELLATASQPMSIAPVAQTVQSGLTQLGRLGAFATSSGTGRRWTKRFNEHGMLFCMLNVRSDLTWQQGLERRFSRLTRQDHFTHDLALLGEQPVYSKEVYADGTSGDDDVWGYQPRYEEYRHKLSRVTGQMRSNYTASLDVWHLALDFGSRPVLNNAFIEDDPPIERVIYFPDEPELILDCYFMQRMTRLMPQIAKPGLTRF